MQEIMTPAQEATNKREREKHVSKARRGGGEWGKAWGSGTSS